MAELEKGKKINSDGLSNVLSGKGDLYDQEQHTRPDKPKDFDDEFCRNLYRGTGIASAIIDRPVDRAVRVGWKIKSPKEEEFDKMLEKVKFVKKLKKALKYERIYGGAIMVFGLNDSGSFDSPLSENYTQGIDFIRVYRREQIRALDPVKDPNDSRYGYPEYYQISTALNTPYKVHYSRCILLEGLPVDEDTLQENDGWGDSVFVSTWDCIRRYDDTLDTMKRIADNYVNVSIEIDGLFAAIRAGQENEIRKRLAVFNSTMHAMNFAIHDKDEKIEKIASNATGLKDIFTAMVDDCSTSSGIPARVLFGKQIGGLNNEGKGETEDWVEYIEDFNNEKTLPILKDTLAFMTNEDPDIKFNKVVSPTAKEEAEIYKLTSEADAINITHTILDPEECRVSHYGGDEFSVKVTIDPKMNIKPYDPKGAKDPNIEGDK